MVNGIVSLTSLNEISINLIKHKRFCKAKEIINKMKRQPMSWEKIFENDATDKGLISKIY